VALSFNIKLTTTPAYNPKSNPVERFHRDMEAALIALGEGNPKSWPDNLPAVLYATRSTPSRMTG
jgi:hypothetical protein